MKKSYQYGKVDWFLHWAVALNMFGTLVFSFGMSSLPEAMKPMKYGAHGLSVTTLLILMIIRLLWRTAKGFPDYPATMQHWQKVAARAAHYSLYLAIFLQITVGILLASTTRSDFIALGYNINYSAFNLLPDDLYPTVLSIHKFGYWLIVSLISLHIAAALKHHFIDKDDVLNAMLPLKKNK